MIGENVLNFHSSDDCYYEEWYDDIKDKNGYIVFLNFREHIIKEMLRTGLNHYVNLGNRFNEIEWRAVKPFHIHKLIENLLMKSCLKMTAYSTIRLLQ